VAALACPRCSLRTPLKAEGVAGLPVNKLLVKVLERKVPAGPAEGGDEPGVGDQKGPDATCKECEERPARIYCEVCQAGLCGARGAARQQRVRPDEAALADECSAAAHSMRLTRGHRRVPISHAPQKDRVCEKHKETCTIWCFTCLVRPAARRPTLAEPAAGAHLRGVQGLREARQSPVAACNQRGGCRQWCCAGHTAAPG
jgi:hypothetical protein